MTDTFEWPNETEYEDEEEFLDLEATFLIDNEDLPPDHRSGYAAVVGRPNAGKSTLMNAFLGQKIAIISHKPQTTRNQLLGILTIPSRHEPEPLINCPPAQVIFVDTPGIHQPLHKLGEFLVEMAVDAINDADVIVWLVEAHRSVSQEDDMVAQSLRRARDKMRQQGKEPTPVILALNKIDLVEPEDVRDVEKPFLKLYDADSWLPLSIKENRNRTELLRQIIHYLPPGPRYFPEEQITDQQTRFIAGELVREAALKVLHQEVPHALAVQVVEFKPRHEKLTYISANIILERKSQKKIVIGTKGRTLKKIGQMSRPEIEKLIGTKVYLELWVKVRPKWRKKPNDLYWLGYSK